MADPTPAPRHAAVRAILWGGLIASFCDMIFAFLSYGWRLGVFQSVAGGLIGRPEARAGGVPTFVLGLALHYLIGVIWAALYWLASRRATALLKHPVPCGLVYGAVIFYGMNCVVLPLSALHAKAWPPPVVFWPIAVHMVFVGLPIALAARWFAAPRPVTAAV